MRKILIIFLLSLFTLCACSDANSKDKPKEKLTLEKIKEDHSIIYGKWNGNIYNATMTITESEEVGVALEIEILYEYEGGHTMTYELTGRYDDDNQSIYCYGRYIRTMYYADGRTEEEVKAIDYHMEISENAVVRFGDTLFEKDGYEPSLIKETSEKGTKKEEPEFTDEYILSVGRQYISRAIDESTYSEYHWEYIKDYGVTKTVLGYTATYYVYFEERHTYKYVRVNMGVSGDELYYANGGV